MRLQGSARALLVFAVFFASFFCRAQEPQGTLAPPEIFVGDTAVFTYTEDGIPQDALSVHANYIHASSARAAMELPPDLLPVGSSDVSVKKVRLLPLQGREDAVLCEITFVPWKTGEIVIPSFAFDAEGNIRSRPVAVSVSSLAERQGIRTLAANRPPLLPPGTVYLAYAFILCLAAAGFFIALATRKFLRRAKVPRRILAKKIRRKFAKLLKRLRRRIGKDQASWYTEFSANVRLFFYKMTDERKYLAADARDIARFLSAAKAGSEQNAQSAEKLITALYEIERMRFGGKPFAEKDGSLERKHIEVLEGFVLSACSAPEAFFATEENGAAKVGGNAPLMKRKSHVVV